MIFFSLLYIQGEKVIRRSLQYDACAYARAGISNMLWCLRDVSWQSYASGMSITCTPAVRYTRHSVISWLFPPHAKHLPWEPHNFRATLAETRGGTLCPRGEGRRKTIRSALRQSACLKPLCWGTRGQLLFMPALRFKQSARGYVVATTHPPAPLPSSSESPQRPVSRMSAMKEQVSGSGCHKVRAKLVQMPTFCIACEIPGL